MNGPGEHKDSHLHLLAWVFLLGVSSGLLEVGLRMESRLGLSTVERLKWMAVSATLSLCFCGLVLGICWLVPALRCRAHGGVLAGLSLLHVGLWYRYDVVLNAFLYAPKVWGGLLALTALCLALGWFGAQTIRRASRAIGFLAVGLSGVGVVLGFIRPQPEGQIAPAGDGPSVLLVTLDTARADRVDANGLGARIAPTVARLAREGTEFRQAVATAPLTEPSHLAILTGQPPVLSGVVSNGTHIGTRPRMLSHVLGRERFATAAFVSAFPLHGRYGWAQGFDVYDDDFGAMPGLHRLSLVKAWDQVALEAHVLREREGAATAGRALRWLQTHADERFFLWLHLFDPHGPYEAPGRAIDGPVDGERLELPAYWPEQHKEITSTQWLTDAYEAEVTHADAQVGLVLDALDEMGRLDDTIVVLTADHGESLTEHGYLFDHGDHLYDASLRVPLVVRHPESVKAGHQIDCQVSNLDVTPTLLTMLGLDDGLERAGRDLSDALAGGACRDHPVLSTTVAGRFVENPPIDHGVRANSHKLIRHAERSDGDPARLECYNLSMDPGETRSLSACPDRLSRLLDAALAGRVDVVDPELDISTREALEALGYIE